MKLRQYLLSTVLLVIALAVMAIPVSADLNDIDQGDTVFIGEKGLDITNAMDAYTWIAWWAPENPVGNPPSWSKQISVPENFEIGSEFVGREGEWWRYTPGNHTPTELAFVVREPTADLIILDLNYMTPLDVTDKAAKIGDYLDFEISSELYLIQQRYPAGDFDFEIEVKKPGDVVLENLYIEPGTVTHDLTYLDIDSDPWYWSTGDGILPDWHYAWMTDAKEPVYNTFRYQPGVYEVTIKCSQNGLNFSSTTRTVELYENKLDITIDPNPVIRGNNSYVTVIGVPGASYFVWIKDCSGQMTGYECDQPPLIVDNMESWLTFDEPYYIYWGDQQLECSGCLKTIWETVPHYPDDGVYYYALVTLDSEGERTIELQTSVDTKPGTYIVRAQPYDSITFPYINPSLPYVEKTLTVNIGVVTFETYVYGEPNNSAYLGDTIKISGTNTDSGTTYLFMTGPCQDCVGEDLMAEGAVENGNPDSFTVVDVKPDGTWEYLWQTRNLQIDLGEYTIYAASKPNDAPSLVGFVCDDCHEVSASCAAWSKKIFTFLEPGINADISPKVLKIVCCDEVPIIVSGSATGIYDYIQDGDEWYQEAIPIGFWVFGENKVAGQKYVFDVAYTDCPGSTFEIDISDYINTLRLEPGTYTVIVQHPMYNHRLDIIPEDWIYDLSELYWAWWETYLEEEIWYPDANREFVVTATPVRWSKLFVIDGPDRLAGSVASSALINGFADPNIDDKILVLTFKVESNTVLQADFSGIPTSGSAPLAVQFTDISTGSPTQWLWNFGDGGTSTLQNPSHTYANVGTYDVTLTVTGLTGTASITKTGYISVGTGPTPTVTPTVTPPPGTDTINMNNGWNFISTPRTLADGANTAGVVFASVNTAGHSIYLYDAGSGLWQSLTASSPVKPLDGIWIYSSGAIQVPLTFKNDPLATPPVKALYTGWNSIGFSDLSPAATKDTLRSVMNEWTQAIGFDSASQAYETSIINGGSGSHSDTNPMYPTKGYWLYMSSPGTLAAISA